MIVYEVYYSDCRYEGGGTDGVFSTYEKAREYALARVAEREHYRQLRIRQDRREGHDWKEPLTEYHRP